MVMLLNRFSSNRQSSFKESWQLTDKSVNVNWVGETDRPAFCGVETLLSVPKSTSTGDVELQSKIIIMFTRFIIYMKIKQCWWNINWFVFRKYSHNWYSQNIVKLLDLASGWKESSKRIEYDDFSAEVEFGRKEFSPWIVGNLRKFWLFPVCWKNSQIWNSDHQRPAVAVVRFSCKIAPENWVFNERRLVIY